jgi:hypothetical protein
MTGYGLTTGIPGLFDIAGSWAFDGPRRLAGTYTETLSGTNLLSGLLTAKNSSGKKIAAKVFSDSGITLRSLKGARLNSPPDLSGTWSAVFSRAGATVNETYTLTASSVGPGVFDLAGSGPGTTITGTLIVTSRNTLDAFLVVDAGLGGTSSRSLSGKFNSSKQTLSLKGADNLANSIRITATRQ